MVDIALRQEDLAKKRELDFELSALFLINQYMTVTYTEWLSMDSLTRKALFNMSQEAQRQKQQQFAEMTRKQELDSAHQNSRIKFPFAPGSGVSKILGTG